MSRESLSDLVLFVLVIALLVAVLGGCKDVPTADYDVVVQLENAKRASEQSPVPEPAMMYMLGAGAIGAIAWYRRKR